MQLLPLESLSYESSMKITPLQDFNSVGKILRKYLKFTELKPSLNIFF